MLSEKSIKVIVALFAVSFTGMLGLLFSIPGLLFGGIISFFGAMILYEKLHGFLPDSRRRRRQSLRNEGLL